tara:strand:+ start:553 stop:1425 length:873 start_codon:yes stop_codon:yes gene_type:complete
MNNNEDFIYIEDCKNDVYRLIKEIYLKCDKLEEIYKEYLKEAVKKNDYLVSLDILFFQIELTREDINNYNKLFKSFLSKMYGNYYKFYKKVNNHLKDVDTKEIFSDIALDQDFTPYDDINYKEYSFEEIQALHNLITSIINNINQHISRQKYTVEDDEVRIKKGININHLVFEKTHDIEILTHKNRLFEKILSNYYEFQKKFLKRMMLKLKILFCQLDSDIQFETVTYSSRASVTTKLDEKILNNKDNNQLEEILYSELDLKEKVVIKNSYFIMIKNFIRNIFRMFCVYN